MTPKIRNWMAPRVLGAILAAASALLVFIRVADGVVEGETRALDTAIMLALRAPGNPAEPLGPPWFQDGARDITALGGPAVLGLLVVVTAVFLLLSGRRRTALFVVAATAGGTLVSTLLKELFGRPRPELVPHGAYVFTASFPSGHAMLSAVVYLTLGTLVARLVTQRRLQLYVMGVAVLLSVLVGISRVYLGVHWPSDVVAGWAGGALWALVCWGAAQLLNQANGGAT